ncbi:MAG TPA: cytochrome P450 [Pirellulales bacterium]|nr:cytochrome P450 [Pirellulales bacterium]
MLSLNFLSDDMRRDPFPIYDHLRANGPVMFEPQSGLWMIFDYAGVRQALSDTDAFASDLASVAAHPTPPWLVFNDPPRHTKLRNIISQAFTPRMVAALEPRIAALSQELLGRSIERGEMDLAADFSIPLPMRVIAEMIGIPDKDWPCYVRWSNATLKLSYTIRGISPGGDVTAQAMSEYSDALAEMRAYLPRLIDERRSKAQPRERGDSAGDLLDRLVAAEVDGERLSPEELLGFFQLLIVGGQETTTNLINNAVLCLLENPDQLALLRRSPERLATAIEEVLRYRSPFQFVFRGTRREVEVHGQTIPAGKLVLLMLGSANRDPKQFPDADRFDMTRDPNPHLAFGHGIHFCLGAGLSRLEARVALADLIHRLPGLELATSEPWQPRPALHVHGPLRLPVRFQTPSHLFA